MIVQNDFGLVHTILRGPYNHVKEWELFDLNGDPEKDLASEKPERVRDLKAKMESWVSEMTGNRPDILTIRAEEGGWTFGHGAFLKGLVKHLDIARSDPHVWPYVLKKTGGRLGAWLDWQKADLDSSS
jgi:hypothetical protein